MYKIEDSRSYFAAWVSAIGLTIILTIIVTVGLAALLGWDFLAGQSYLHVHDQFSALVAAISARVICWIIASCMRTWSFAVVYYWAPDCNGARDTA